MKAKEDPFEGRTELDLIDKSLLLEEDENDNCKSPEIRHATNHKVLSNNQYSNHSCSMSPVNSDISFVHLHSLENDW